MQDIQELIAEARRQGVKLWTCDGRISAHGSGEKLLTAIRAREVEVVSFLDRHAVLEQFEGEDIWVIRAEVEPGQKRRTKRTSRDGVVRWNLPVREIA